jgi:hypothetical protein
LEPSPIETANASMLSATAKTITSNMSGLSCLSCQSRSLIYGEARGRIVPHSQFALSATMVELLFDAVLLIRYNTRQSFAG